MDGLEGTSVGAIGLKDCLESATRWLERNAAQIDALNVFPVPDGDTGSNMLLSMRAGLEELRSAGPRDAAQAAAAFSRGALIGAQGNSGVILSQFWEGLARAARPGNPFTADSLVVGLQEASRLAFQAVSEPVEGTMLTTIRELAREAAVCAERKDLAALVGRLVQAARRSVDRTPDLLPVLRRAGVVDSGSRGLYVILEGFLHGLRVRRGQAARGSFPASRRRPRGRRPPAAPLAGGSSLGYCAEFLVQGRGLDPEAIRAALRPRGGSLIVTGADGRVRVHIHTRDPGSVLERAASFGGLDRVQVRDMDRQRRSALRQSGAGPGRKQVSAAGGGRPARGQTVGIVTDSVADLPPALAEDLGISVVPLIVRFGQEAFRDGVDLTADQFYDKLRDSPSFPGTAVPSPAVFADAFDSLAEHAGSILAVTVTSKLSGTHNAALLGRRMMKRTCRVEVFDSGTATMTEGFIVMRAAQAARDGGSLEEVLEAARGAASRVGFLSTFDTLEYLRRGGRIGAASAFLGSVLKVNPLITLEDGVVKPAGRTRSRARAVERLVEFVAAYERIEELVVENTACPEEAEALVERLGSFHPAERIRRSKMTPVIGAHTGPGLLLVGVLGDRTAR